jgi:hypothetical protein
MGFLCKTPTPESVPVVSSTETQLPAWYQEALKGLTVQASDIANQPYQPYGGQRQAGFNPDQLNSFQGVRNNVGSFMPGYLMAGMSAGAGSDSVLNHLPQYMNPYQQQVTDIAKREAQRQFGFQQQARDAQQVKAGAFGNTRGGIENAEAMRNLNTSLNDIQMKGSADAFTQAGQLYGADAARQLQAAGIYQDLGTNMQSAGLRDAAAVQAIGDTQQAQSQKGYDLAYNDFLEQRDFPKTQAGWLSGILRGASDVVPKQTTTNSTQLSPQQSPLAQLAGAGLSAYGLFNMLKARGGLIRKKY